MEPPKSWSIGPAEHSGETDAIIALHADQLGIGTDPKIMIGIHEAADKDLPRAPIVQVFVPPYRPKTFVAVLSWLAAKLVTDDGIVRWTLSKRQGPDSLRKTLLEQGWHVDKRKVKNAYHIEGLPSSNVHRPKPGSFSATLGNVDLELEADYGVFSPNQIDEGTFHLLNIALRSEKVESVADIGVGYGPLALGLVSNAIADKAIGSDTDLVALWLARRNSRALGAPLEVYPYSDPTELPPTPLTVCNIPTHIRTEASACLVSGLARRARQGKLLAVVHSSLQNRYATRLETEGLIVKRHPGVNHVVLESIPKSR